MIFNKVTCEVQETQKYIQYLKTTPVKRLASLLQSREFLLKKGGIRSLNCLGSLKTEFGDLGGLSSPHILGQEKFFVNQVLEILEKPNCTDKKSLESIKYFMKLDEEGKTEYGTIIFHNGDYIIKDGNKRAVAFYERRKKINEIDIAFPVYIIERSQL